ELEKWAS
nr:Chain C, GP41 PEPTIDE [Human immunodeficiency virus 1]